MNYRNGKRPQRDITTELHGDRPLCAVCGNRMAKAGATHKGLQKWRCGKNDNICSTMVHGQAAATGINGRPRLAKLPDDAELSRLLTSGWTYSMIADRYQCSRQTVSNRIWERGLTGLSNHLRPQRTRDQGEPEAANASLVSVSMGRACGGMGWHSWGGIFAMRDEA
jgi:hypothetical protein